MESQRVGHDLAAEQQQQFIFVTEEEQAAGPEPWAGYYTVFTAGIFSTGTFYLQQMMLSFHL